MSRFIVPNVRILRNTALLALFLGTLGCNMDPDGPRLLLVAPVDYIGARVLVDGEEVGILQSQRTIGKLVDWADSRPEHVPERLASLSVDVSGLPEGKHDVLVVRSGQNLIAQTFMVPLTEDALLYAWPDQED